MKKRISSLLLILCCVLTFSNSASAADHVHVWRLSSNNLYEYEIVRYESDGHKCRIFENYDCTSCTETSRKDLTCEKTPEITRPHDFSVFLRSITHLGTGEHQYLFGCSQEECPYTTSKILPCDGPPCTASHLFAIPPENELEAEILVGGDTQ